MTQDSHTVGNGWEASRSLATALQRLFTAGVMSPSGHANASCRVHEHQMLLTPGGVVRHLDPADLATVDFDGRVLAGAIEPVVAEIVPMHAAVYRTRPDLGAVIHTHSPALTAFAVAHHPLPARYEPLLRFGQVSAVPVVPWAPRGSDRSVEGIVEAIERTPGTRAVLLANHGVLAFADSVTATADLIVALEEAAAAELAGQALGGTRDFPPQALEEVSRSMARAGSRA